MTSFLSAKRKMFNICFFVGMESLFARRVTADGDVQSMLNEDNSLHKQNSRPWGKKTQVSCDSSRHRAYS